MDKCFSIFYFPYKCIHKGMDNKNKYYNTNLRWFVSHNLESGSLAAVKSLKLKPDICKFIKSLKNVSACTFKLTKSVVLSPVKVSCTLSSWRIITKRLLMQPWKWVSSDKGSVRIASTEPRKKYLNIILLQICYCFNG